MIRIARLWQPRHPAFWLMCAFNALSALLAWVARAHDLTPFAASAVAIFAIGNGVFGLLLAARLLRTPTSAERGAIR